MGRGLVYMDLVQAHMNHTNVNIDHIMRDMDPRWQIRTIDGYILTPIHVDIDPRQVIMHTIPGTYMYGHGMVYIDPRLVAIDNRQVDIVTIHVDNDLRQVYMDTRYIDIDDWRIYGSWKKSY